MKKTKKAGRKSIRERLKDVFGEHKTPEKYHKYLQKETAKNEQWMKDYKERYIKALRGELVVKKGKARDSSKPDKPDASAPKNKRKKAEKPTSEFLEKYYGKDWA